jgi:1,3-beta-glucanosyltransferase GAS5
METSGMVQISADGKTANPLDDFRSAQNAFSHTPDPGDGGYTTIPFASLCPPEASSWQVNTSLPLIPQPALKFKTNGAGAAPGLGNSTGSQWKGTPSSGWSPPMDQSDATSATSSPKKSAAISPRAPTGLSCLVFIVVIFELI